MGYYILLAVYFVVAVFLITLIMLQQGKGADAGALGGTGGASNTVFGSSGSATFLSRLTALFATVFFVGALLIANINAHRDSELNKVSSTILQKLDSQNPDPSFNPKTIPTPAKPDSNPSIPGIPSK